MMKDREILVGLDIGTSGVRAVAYSAQGETIAEGRAELRVSYPASDRAEQCPEDWWLGSAAALRQLAFKLGGGLGGVAGIGLTGQCPTFTLMRPNGETPGIGWLYADNRAVAEADWLAGRFGGETIHSRTGQRPSPFYIAPKLLWLKHEGLLRGGEAVVQPRDYVGWQLTGVLATDPTHAACTLLYDIESGEWAKDWIAELGLDSLVWPEIIPSCSFLGRLSAEASSATGFPAGIPVAAGGADSLCAIYGALGLAGQRICDVSGTSTCLHLAVKEPVLSPAVNTYPHMEPGIWCAEAGLNTTGIAVRWLSGIVGMDYDRMFAAAAETPPGSEGLLFLPHLSGGERDFPGRPGAFVGLHLGHQPGHLIRAVLEGIAFGLRQRVETIRDSGNTAADIVSCGGGASNPLWNQIKADVLGMPLTAVHPPDTTAYGAAMAAAKALKMAMPAVCGEEGTAFHRTEYVPGENSGRYADGYRRFCGLENTLAGL